MAVYWIDPNPWWSSLTLLGIIPNQYQYLFTNKCEQIFCKCACEVIKQEGKHVQCIGQYFRKLLTWLLGKHAVSYDYSSLAHKLFDIMQREPDVIEIEDEDSRLAHQSCDATTADNLQNSHWLGI